MAFDRPEGARSVVAIQIYASRYGLPEPPRRKIFTSGCSTRTEKCFTIFAFPTRRSRGARCDWYTLDLPSTDVPERFYVALSFNPHQTKGIYLGLDKNVKESHSYVGLPEQGYEPVDKQSDWMVRVYLAKELEQKP